ALAVWAMKPQSQSKLRADGPSERIVSDRGHDDVVVGRSRQSHMALGLPPICIRAAIRFVANTPPATRDGVVSSVVVHAISPKKPGEDDRIRAAAASGHAAVAPQSRATQAYPKANDHKLSIAGGGHECIAAKADGSCPLWVRSGLRPLLGRCPLYPRKRTK